MGFLNKKQNDLPLTTIIHLFKKHNIQFQEKEAKLSAPFPWFLCVGAERSGKTTLLEHVGSKQTASLGFAQSKVLRFLSNAVFVDTPNCLVDDAQQLPPIWNSISRAFLKARKNTPLAGIFFLIDIQELLREKGIESYLRKQQQSMMALAHLFQTRLPIYIVLTKTDLLSGFVEFFGDLSEEERDQAWGFSLPAAEGFDKAFDRMLERLNKRLIWRMHQEHHMATRAKIKDFPLQVEQLKPILSKLIYYFANPPHHQDFIDLQGFYFTSAIRAGEPKNPLSSNLSKNFELQVSPTLSAYAPPSPQPYFVRQLFQSIAGNSLENTFIKAHAISPWRRRVALTAAMSTILGCSFFWMNNLNTTLANIDSANHFLMSFAENLETKPLAELPLPEALSKLEALQQANNLYQHTQVPWIANVLHHQQDLKNLAAQAYHLALQTTLLPRLRNAIEQQLQNADIHQPDHLYAELKVYLMLNEPNHLDSHFMIDWLHHQAQVKLTTNEKLQPKIDQQLTELFQHMPPSSGINQNIVSQARSALYALPKSALASVILKNDSPEPFIDLFQTMGADEKQLFVRSQQDQPFSALYTKNEFYRVYNLLIPHVAQEAVYGNWVLGIPEDSSTSLASVIDETRHLYVNDYINAWQTVLLNTQIKPLGDLNSALSALTLLTSNRSPLFSLVETVEKNINLPEITSQMDQGDNNSGLNIGSTLINLKNIEYSHVLAALTSLEDYILRINNATDPGQSAFLSAKSRMAPAHENEDALTHLRLLAAQMPKPMSDWLNQLSENVWSAVLHRAHQYVDAVWKTTVYPHYQSTLLNHYPFTKDSKIDVALDDFTYFFSSGGVMDTFFGEYIVPFLDTKQSNWTPKIVDGESMPFSNAVIEQFERAELIGDMFFPNNSPQPVFSFVLKPQAIEPSLKQVRIKLNDQILEETPSNHNEKQFMWPAYSAKDESGIYFQAADGKVSQLILPGIWAWFKLLDKAHVVSTGDVKIYEVLFDLDGNAAKFTLIAGNQVNPFVPGIVDHFRAPERL